MLTAKGIHFRKSCSYCRHGACCPEIKCQSSSVSTEVHELGQLLVAQQCIQPSVMQAVLIAYQLLVMCRQVHCVPWTCDLLRAR